ncbi:MAG: DUF3445 domain-containing protein [Fimbriimonas sp.]|nr:DUF3445 domain-containing protein [Fimbriimonas sp.]
MTLRLPGPAQYKPWMKGTYDVAPNLRPFGTDFGNGEADRRLFQFDDQFSRYRENKLRCLSERPGKYVARHELSSRVEEAAALFMVQRLTTEWPELFILKEDNLVCRLTGDSIPYDLEEIVNQVPEDIAVVISSGGRNWTAFIHLCSPSHWSAESKIGRSFFDTHRPIPGFDRVNAAADALVQSMVFRGPFVRFVWGLESDDRLNHHPEPPPGEDPSEWYGRRFERGFVVRTERQSVFGLPDVDAAIFAIKVGFVPGNTVLRSDREWIALVAAIRSMTPEAVAYKGVGQFLDLTQKSEG